MQFPSISWTIAGALVALSLTACGGGGGGGNNNGNGNGGGTNPTASFTIGGSVSGLAAGQTLVLTDKISSGSNFSASDTQTLSANQPFTFATAVPQNGSYAVTIVTQPASQTCSINNATGAGVTAAVSDVDVSCSANTYALSGTASGLVAGQSVTLANGSDSVVVSGNGAFSFPTRINEGGSYAVVISGAAPNESCTVSSGSGSGVDADVASVALVCSADGYTIGGTIAGLASGQQVTLRNNGADSLTISANGAFTFATPVAFQGAYVVTVATQPTNEVCSVASGSGSGSGVNANVSSVSLNCSASSYTIGGKVSGLFAGQTLTLKDNGADPLTITGSGAGVDAFVFATAVAYQGSYAVTVGTQPSNEVCSVASGSGTGSGIGASVSTVALTCSADSYSIGGAVTGLASGQHLTLFDNGGDPATVTGSGTGSDAFAFATRVPFNGSYSVTISTQPTNQACSVAAGTGSGAGVNANVSAIALTCAKDTYAIGGTVSGLSAGQVVTLLDNASDAKTITGGGSGADAYTFATKVAYLGSYAVTISTQPTNETCSVASGSGSGSGVNANVTSVNLNCSKSNYTIGGKVTGLVAGQSLTLKDNGADPVTIVGGGTGSDSFVFATAVAYQGSYAVTVSTQPTNEVCSVASGSGSGSGVSANVSTVALACSASSYRIGGTVSGLASGQSLTLLDNGGDAKTITGNGSGTDAFTFATSVPFKGSYAVTISTQPTNQACSLAAGTGAGSGVNADVSSISLTCAKDSYAISGSVSGLAAGQTVTLLDNGGDAKTVTGSGSGTDGYTFATKVPYLGSYAVTISTQPANEVCSVSSGSGAGVTGAVSTTAVACSKDSYSIGGTVTGLASGQTLTLADNGGGGGNTATLTGTGAPIAFTFPSQVAYLGSYAVTAGTQPTSQTCSVQAGTGSGTGVNANVTSVAITCSTRTYTIGGTVTGLASGQTVTLTDNGGTGGNVASVAANGTFTFATPVAYGGSYAVAVTGQPVGQFCTTTGATGSGVVANVSGVAINCTTAWYVSGTGVDTHDGMTPGTAFRTLARASGFVKAGQVVLAMDGTYTNDTGGAVLSISSAGTANAWITYKAYPGAHPVIQTDGIWEGIFFTPTAQYVEVNGFTVVGDNASLTLAGAQAVESNPAANPKYNGNCIAAQAAKTPPYPHHLRILNNNVSECPGGGIATIGADYVTISGNTVFDNALYSAYGCSGISTLIDYDSNPSDTTTPYKMIITNNVVYGNQELIPWGQVGYISDGEGIIIDSNHNNAYDATVPYPAYTGRTLVANNVVYSNGSAAIEVYQSSHVDVVNNSTLDNVLSPTGLSAAQSTHVNGRGEMNLGQISDVNVFNNIFYSLAAQNPVTQGSACTSCSVDYNLYYGGTNSRGTFGANGAHDKVGDPLYSNIDTTKPASISLQLRAGSPAIGSGTSRLAPATDINGNARPSKSGYTIGAYSQ